jgi:hypothetical protein
MNSNNPIQTEPRDPLKAFCEAYVRENGRNPINESQLAEAFVRFFGIRPLVDLSSLDEFFHSTNIDLRKGDLPLGLLGVNMSFEGKRRIDLSERPEQRYFQVHTVLHEIREIIETELRPLGFGTSESERDLEHLANEFAFYAMISSQMSMFRTFFESACEMESKWQKFGALGLIGIGVIVAAVYSFMGAFFPHVTVTPSEMRFER